MTKLLRITAPHFTAGAVYRFTGKGQWILEECSPILKWLYRTPREKIRPYCQRKGWKMEWLKAEK